VATEEGAAAAGYQHHQHRGFIELFVLCRWAFICLAEALPLACAHHLQSRPKTSRAGHAQRSSLFRYDCPPVRLCSRTTEAITRSCAAGQSRAEPRPRCHVQHVSGENTHQAAAATALNRGAYAAPAALAGRAAARPSRRGNSSQRTHPRPLHSSWIASSTLARFLLSPSHLHPHHASCSLLLTCTRTTPTERQERGRTYGPPHTHTPNPKPSVPTPKPKPKTLNP